MVVLPWLKDVPKLQALECTVGIQYQSAWLHDDWEIEDCWPSASCVSSAKCCRCEHSIGIEQGSEGLLRSMQSDSLPKLVEGFRLANIRMLNAKCPGTVRANPKCENALIISCRGRARRRTSGFLMPKLKLHLETAESAATAKQSIALRDLYAVRVISDTKAAVHCKFSCRKTTLRTKNETKHCFMLEQKMQQANADQTLSFQQSVPWWLRLGFFKKMFWQLIAQERRKGCKGAWILRSEILSPQKTHQKQTKRHTWNFWHPCQRRVVWVIRNRWFLVISCGSSSYSRGALTKPTVGFRSLLESAKKTHPECSSRRRNGMEPKAHETWRLKLPFWDVQGTKDVFVWYIFDVFFPREVKMLEGIHIHTDLWIWFLQGSRADVLLNMRLGLSVGTNLNVEVSGSAPLTG